MHQQGSLPWDSYCALGLVKRMTVYCLWVSDPFPGGVQRLPPASNLCTVDAGLDKWLPMMVLSLIEIYEEPLLMSYCILPAGLV